VYIATYLPSKVVIVVGVLLASVVLVACQSKYAPSAMFDNYLYRLTNSLQADRPSPSDLTPQMTLQSYPSRRVLRKKIPAIDINVVEFLRLTQCDLQRHIGLRNSGLGKVILPSQQLLYDIRFISLAQQCLQILTPSSTSYKIVEHALAYKQRHLDDVMWNATWASKEFATLFSLGVEPLSMSAVKQASLPLNRALDGLYYGLSDIRTGRVSPQFLERLEEHYRVIGSVKRVGEIRLAMRQIVLQLAQADKLLQQRSMDTPLCVNQQVNKQYAIVATVFKKYYLGEVQPYIAQIHQQGQRLFTTIGQLSSLYTPPSVFQSFWDVVYQANNSEWQQFQGSIRRHTQHWQALLKQCGQLPQ